MALRPDYPKRIGPTTLGLVAAIFYTAPTRVRVRYLCLSNYSGNAVTVTLYVIPVGGSVVDANAMMKVLSVPANDMLTPSFSIVLEPGETLQALASVATSVNLTATVTDQERD